MEDENDEVSGKVPFPWRTLATNAAIVGGAHFAGQMGAGVALNALGKSRLGDRIARMPPEARNRLFMNVGSGASGLAALALQAQHMAATARIQQELDQHKMTKKASVCAAYSAALRAK